MKTTVTKENEAQHVVEQITDTKFLLLEAWDPGLAVNNMGTAIAHAVLSRRSFA
jgi:hypothetical protein